MLSSGSIRREIDRGMIRYDHEDEMPERYKFIEGCAFNVSLADIYLVDQSKTPVFTKTYREIAPPIHVGFDESGLRYCAPGQYQLITNEYFTMGDRGGQFCPRSSYFTAGITIFGTIIAPGFSGILRVRMEVPVGGSIIFGRGADIGQVIFWRYDTPEIDYYNGVWRGYKVGLNGREKPR
jgi:deoxycytidine triphosphate deaminase